MFTPRRLPIALASLLALIALAACGNDRDIEPRLDVSYVSGHLGSDYGCSSGAKSALWAGDCAAESPNTCGNFCEDGAVTLQLENSGNVALLGLDVEQLILSAAGASTTTLSITDIKRDDGNDFDGSLEPGANVKVRVRFPAPGYEAVPKGGTIEVIVITGGGKEQRVITPELHVLPSVAT